MKTLYRIEANADETQFRIKFSRFGIFWTYIKDTCITSGNVNIQYWSKLPDAKAYVARLCANKVWRIVSEATYSKTYTYE